MHSEMDAVLIASLRSTLCVFFVLGCLKNLTCAHNASTIQHSYQVRGGRQETHRLHRLFV